jgi:(1->4)-alpha-D-glucan 1-alpha-D-glucosylmutase
LYVYQPLLSLNEVGGDPAPDAISPQEFFEFIEERQKTWPHSMNASSTHDTKRAEDVRARISVLSEIPQEWQKRLNYWATLNEIHKTGGNGAVVPDRNEEYFLYQTLLGMWPLDQSELPAVLHRLQSYAVKATREAMVHTRWTRPNLPHEERLTKFLGAILDEKRSQPFLQDFREFHRVISFHGMLNGLSQTLLKIATPGVPDFYQGSELWDFRLVDPDNRGTVDFERRIELLDALKRKALAENIPFAEELLKNWGDGRIKLYVIWKALSFRGKCRELFTDGDFVPAEISGQRAEHLTAFFRAGQNESALIVAPKWLANSGLHDGSGTHQDFWADTSISLRAGDSRNWRNIFTGESATPAAGDNRSILEVADLLRHFPVALLSSTPA